MKEEEIRKREVFSKYLELVATDVNDFFDFKSFIDVDCPACGSSKSTFEFEKIGFKYSSCQVCSTLFVNPKPPFEVLNEFYSTSSSTSFWVNEFFKPVAEVRREKIFKPRAEYVAGFLDKSERHIVGDIGAGFGLFLEELKKIRPDNRYVAIEPSVEMAHICHSKGLDVEPVCLEELEEMAEGFDILTAFELLEHLYSPQIFLEKAYELLKPGGYLSCSTLNSKGFDILLLWEKSKSIAPPHHLNFFNPMSIHLLFQKAGFEIEEISTPGKLDWDIVEGMITNENLELGKLWDVLAKEGSDECKNELQHWISKYNLSSHMRVLAKKR